LASNLVAAERNGRPHLLAAQDLGEVDVEEVNVEAGLDEAGDDGDRVDRVLGEVAEDQHETGREQVVSALSRQSLDTIARAADAKTHRKIQLGM